jgi:hypothetical protein
MVAGVNAEISWWRSLGVRSGRQSPPNANAELKGFAVRALRRRAVAFKSRRQ